MTRTRRIAGLTLAMLSVVLLDACRHKAPEPPAPVQTAAPRGPDADSARLANEAAARRAAADEAARRRADSIANAANNARDAAGAAAALRASLTATVHFEYDQSDLRPGDKAILDAKVPILQANPGVMIRVGGHTDERGSDEYNLALGQKRAEAMKRMLLLLGAREEQVEAVSLGEEKPKATGSTEEAFAENRRDDILYGGEY